MKKLLSLVIAIIITLSIAVVPSNVLGKTTNVKKQKVTYMPRTDNFVYSKGEVYLEGDHKENNLYFVDKKGKTQRLTKHNKGEVIQQFVVRGDRVYYMYIENPMAHDPDYSLFPCFLKSVKIDGTDRTTHFKKETRFGATLVGLYGTSIIYCDGWNYIRKYKNGKTTTIFSVKSMNQGGILFSGKLYIGNKCVDIETKKVTSFKKKQMLYNKNYLYYLNKNNNLKRIDKNGKREIVEKKVKKIFALNDDNNVVFAKKGTSKVEKYYYVYYIKKDVKGKKYKLCDICQIEKACGVKHNLGDISKVCFDDSGVYFQIYNGMVAKTSLTGSVPELVYDEETYIKETGMDTDPYFSYYDYFKGVLYTFRGKVKYTVVAGEYM